MPGTDYTPCSMTGSLLAIDSWLGGERNNGYTSHLVPTWVLGCAITDELWNLDLEEFATF